MFGLSSELLFEYQESQNKGCFRGLFIYDEAFLQKLFTTKSREIFLQKILNTPKCLTLDWCFYINSEDGWVSMLGSSTPEVLWKKNCCQKFWKIHKKTSAGVSFWQRGRLKTCNFIVKKLGSRCYLMNFVKYLRRYKNTNHVT